MLLLLSMLLWASSVQIVLCPRSWHWCRWLIWYLQAKNVLTHSEHTQKLHNSLVLLSAHCLSLNCLSDTCKREKKLSIRVTGKQVKCVCVFAGRLSERKKTSCSRKRSWIDKHAQKMFLSQWVWCKRECALLSVWMRNVLPARDLKQIGSMLAQLMLMMSYNKNLTFCALLARWQTSCCCCCWPICKLRWSKHKVAHTHSQLVFARVLF